MNCKEDKETPYSQFEAILMAGKTSHTQAHSINKNIDNSNLSLINQITWELPPSTQPRPETIPSFNPDPPELVPTCK